MRGFTLLGKEFLSIIKNKKLLIPIIAVLFIPFLYSGMFLKAFWDPYANLEDLPVAVVNLDKGAVNDGKSVEVGKEFVDNLKDNKNFKWEFVSEKKAKQGFDDRKYYMIIRVPSNFSENATTLLKKHPEKLELEYIPNESFNFLSAQIGGSAVEKIKEEIANTLSATYAEGVFDSIREASDGIVKASDGANQLHDGIGTAKDGSGQITDGMNQLVDPTGKFESGLGQLSKGSNDLAGGLGDLTEKANAGLGQLSKGSNDLAGGLGGLATKANAGLGQLADGASKLANPKGEFQSGLGQLSKGSNDLAGGLGQFVDPTGEFQKGLGGIQKGSKDLANGVTEMKAQVPGLTKGSADLNEGLNGVSKSLTAWKKEADGATTDAQKVAADLEKLNAQLDQLPNQDKSNLKQLVSELIKENKKVVNTTATLSAEAGGISDSTVKLSKGADLLHQGQVKLEEGIVGKLKDGQDGLAAGSTNLANGVEKLAIKTNTGLGNLSKGSNDLAKGLGQLANPKGEFQTGLGKLQGGLGQLVNPKGEFQEGLGKLQGGSKQLAGGLGQLVDPKGEFQEGLGKLQGGSKQLAGGLSELVNPTGELQVNLGKLQGGSKELTDGLGKLNDGSGELANGLNEGAAKAGDVKVGKANYKMFADPVKVKTEKVAEVPNYGTGFTPYFLSLGLFVGALLLSIVFPLRETVGIPKSGFSWFISKFGVLVVVGILQAIVADIALFTWLDLKVHSVPYFILFSIITSFTFIALIQFLVTTFGDAGRFLAIITLILQLTTSAGTFPLELIPGWMQSFNAWLPMTYSVSGFKAVVSSGDFSFMWQNAGILAVFIVLLELGTIATLTFLHKHQFKRSEKAE